MLESTEVWAEVSRATFCRVYDEAYFLRLRAHPGCAAAVCGSSFSGSTRSRCVAALSQFSSWSGRAPLVHSSSQSNPCRPEALVLEQLFWGRAALLVSQMPARACPHWQVPAQVSF
ncbi:unnamed protein product [Prorocentrum cordatum]|uniref:Uncharacterized protein n=1 Tax=Prorocentrum cordatum TaxID=2364126 RepID=A0ABN9UWF6_9DINO|nr:unnamed protein product [Polarella glacialis]